MRRIVYILMIVVVLLFTSCQRQDNISNPYFFLGIENKAQYHYQGSIWTDAWLIDADHSNVVRYYGYPDEEYDDEGLEVDVILNVSRIANLKKGIVYELSFDIFSHTNNIFVQNEKSYYWVTDYEIYEFYPNSDFDYKPFVTNGKIDLRECAIDMERKNVLPNSDELYLRCSNVNLEIDNSKFNTVKLSTDENDITYSYYNSGNTNAIKMVWEKSKGLKYYFFNLGAHREGFRIELISDEN